MSDLFSKNNLIKIGLVSISLILWIYFYLSLGISFDHIITLNLGQIIPTIFSVKFLMFILLFPLTSSLIISFSIKSELSLSIVSLIISLILGSLISVIIFSLNVNYILFFLVYIVSHVVLILLTYSKYKEEDKFTSISNFSLSKISLFLTISIFIIFLIYMLPAQKDYAIKSEAGLVNLIIGNDLSEWTNASYNIGKKSTVTAIDYITSSEKYLSLRYVNDVSVKEYLSYMNDLERDLNNNSDDDIDTIYANLDDVSLKSDLLEAIDSMPIMSFIKSNFAIIFSLLIASFLNLFFVILFSTIGLLYSFIFYKLFYKF